MKIANPIYDVVFKYLMDDNKIAKLVISKIIGEEIDALEFQPKENVVEIELPSTGTDMAKASFTVYRLDFAAKIRLPDGGLKQVLIEIQKAKLPTDIMRFRKYLGQQYSSEKNSITRSANGKERKSAFPIVSIYILGHPLDHETAPIIKVSRHYIDLATGEQLKNKEEFIESLTHDSYVIQIPGLKGKRRNELEKMLSIFDQSQKESDHILNINEADFPEKYHDIIRKLQRAIADENVQNTMDVEDEIIEELANRERKIGDLLDTISEKEKTISEKEKALNEKEKTISEKEKTISENQKALNEKDRLIEELKRKLGEK